MDLRAEAMDDLEKIDNATLTTDQRIQIAQAHALLSVAEELSLIRDQGIRKFREHQEHQEPFVPHRIR